MATYQKKLAEIQIGDHITYSTNGHLETGQVCGWRTILPDHGPYVLVFDPGGQTDKQVGLSAILERRHPGVGGGVIQFT